MVSEHFLKLCCTFANKLFFKLCLIIFLLSKITYFSQNWTYNISKIHIEILKVITTQWLKIPVLIYVLL